MKTEPISICLDSSTKQKIEDYAKVRQVSRSAMIRLLLNEILLTKEKQGDVMR